MPTHHRAFTLVEMLLVVAVIVLLISLLLPTLGQAKSNARSVICLTHLGQLGQASIQYTTDHNGFFWPSDLNGSGSVFMWAGTEGSGGGGYTVNGADDRWLNAYLGRFQQKSDVPLTLCPDDDWLYYSTGNSYGSNNSHATSTFYPTHNLHHGHGDRPMRRNAMVNPNQWFLAGEHGANVWAWNETWQFFDSYFFHTRPGDQRFNALFGDGSARNITVPTATLETDEYDYNYR